MLVLKLSGIQRSKLAYQTFPNYQGFKGKETPLAIINPKRFS